MDGWEIVSKVCLYIWMGLQGIAVGIVILMVPAIYKLLKVIAIHLVFESEIKAVTKKKGKK